jgi:predicted amidohydrolase YtcJ
LDDPTSCGIAIWSNDELLNALVAYDALGYQVHLHAIGDAAVKQALNSIEALQQVNPDWDRRPVIVHAQLICDEDLPRFAQLGVIANIQPLWCYLDPMNKELIAPRIGAERNSLQYRLRSLINAGAMIAFGSDWPVTSHVPMQALNVPITRTNPAADANEPWNLGEAITKEESLLFYTKNVAYQMFREAERGVLEVGKSADFVVLRDDKIEAIYISGELN